MLPLQRLKIICAVVCMLIVMSGCVVKDSPAPGCIQTIGFPSMGGCFGKTAIVDLQVESAPDCVQVKTNNCNGGVLEVRNDCAEPVRLGNVEIQPSDSAILDMVENGEALDLFQISSNFSQYKPESDRKIEFEGQVGEQMFRLTFTKTGPLCE